jgi:hypothetical protein
VYDSVSFDLSSQDTNPRDLVFSGDGTKMYIYGGQSSRIYQYSLSTGFDLSTASYDSVSFDFSSQGTGGPSLALSNDGTKLFVFTYSNKTVFQYSLSTAFDLSTASYDSISFSVGSQDTDTNDITFNNAGTKMYMVGNTNNSVFQYSLSTAFDLSTASYDSVSFSFSSQDTSPYDMAFNSNGTKMYMVGTTDDTIYQYSLSTAFDVGTASYDSISFTLTISGIACTGMFFGSNGTKLYVLDVVTDSIYQYSTALNTASLDLSTGSVFEITPTSDIEVTLSNPADSGTASGATLLLNGGGVADFGSTTYSDVSFSVNSQDTEPQDVSISSDGTKMYMVGNTNNSVFQYSLSVAFDLSTASYDSVSFSVSSQDAQPVGLAFNSDGTKMYMVANLSSSAYQYSLSTAWDLSTTSYDSVSFDFTSQDSSPFDVTFNNDGTKLYMVGSNSDAVYQYSLSTAYDISTASYDSVSFSVSGQATFGQKVKFNSSGTKLYVLSGNDDSVHQYSLSTAFDLSTASYDSVSVSGATQDTSPTGFTFDAADSKMYLAGNSNNTVYEYAIGQVPYIITYDTTINWSGGTAPTSTPIGETDVLTFNTTDGGTSYQGILAIDGAKA